MSHDTRSLLALSLVCVVVAGLLGAALVRLLSRRSLALSLLAASLAPMAGVVIAVLISVREMFLSRHDSKVTLITVLCSALLAAVLSVWLGHRVAVESRALGAQLRGLLTTYDEAPGSVAAPGHPATTRRPRSAELGRLSEELAATRERLEESRRRERMLEASRRELVAFMSHDLRTPLAGLRALAEGLEDGVIDDPPAALARMRVTVERMSGLVDDLFELSRLTSGAPPRRLASVSVTELVEDVATLVADHARSQQVEIAVEAPTTDRLRVTGDADELARALTNLVANAVRHTDPGGTVRLVADRTAEGRVRTQVVDGCGGIDEQDLPRLFDVGWRGSPDRTPDDGGAGLGLAIARGVVQAHDGTIDVVNVPGGCRFEVALPAG